MSKIVSVCVHCTGELKNIDPSVVSGGEALMINGSNPQEKD